MTEKRYFLHKHLGRDVIHDILCHNWLKGEELEEHMNVQYTKYSALKKENEQLKTENNAYLQDIEMFKEENTTLKLENEQLKIENQGQSDTIDGLQEMMAHYNLEELE